MLETKNCIVSQKTKTTEQTQTTFVCFCSIFILKGNQTKLNHTIFYIAVWTTFSLKTQAKCKHSWLYMVYIISLIDEFKN